MHSDASTISRASMETTETAYTAYTAQPAEDVQDVQFAGLEEEEEEEEGHVWQQPSNRPATAAWNVAISQSDFELLREGVEADDINGRWDIKTMPRNPSTNITLVHFARWAARTPDYTLVLHTSTESGEEETSIVAIIWETIEITESLTGDVISEDYAKREVVRSARGLLGCELPGLEELQYDEWWPKYTAWRNRLFD